MTQFLSSEKLFLSVLLLFLYQKMCGGANIYQYPITLALYFTAIAIIGVCRCIFTVLALFLIKCDAIPSQPVRCTI